MNACRLPLALLAAGLALVAFAAPGSAEPPPPAPCATILAPRAAIELPVRVAPGLMVRVRDPYGGLFARDSRFVAFSIRYPHPADRARVGVVTWLVDGQAPRRDEGGRDQLLAPSRMYAAGPHVITVRIVAAAGGPPVEATLQVTATDCRLAFVAAGVDRSGRVTVVADSGGPPLRAIELRPARGRFALPRRGRLGTLTPLPAGPQRTLTAADVASGGRRLRVTGLATTAVRMRFARGVLPRRHACAVTVTLDGGEGAPARLAAGPRC